MACTQTIVVPAQVTRLAITKTAPRQVQHGAAITYRVTLANSGPDAAKDVVVHDPVYIQSCVNTVVSKPAGKRHPSRPFIPVTG